MHKIISTIKFPIFILFLVASSISCNEHKSENFKASNKSPANNDPVGKVIAIVDGDTYDILLDGNKTMRIRMEGIDAPEKGMPFYKVSKKYLSSLCFKSNVHLKVSGKDNHNRTLAFTYLADGRELSHEMVKAGLAWHFKKYSSDSTLANLEIKAREQKLGLWINENPMSPWDNRKLHRKGISTKDSFNIRQGE